MKKIKIILSTISAASFVLLSFNSCSQQANSHGSANQLLEKSPYPVNKTEEEWKKILSPEQYGVIRQKDTEMSFSGKWLENHEKGTYVCAACQNPLFTSEMKFNSGTGWPSFDNEISGGKVEKHDDNSLGMGRTEILCARCGGHLGHLFDDGPTKTGMRYCVNSLSLDFVGEKEGELKAMVQTSDTITLGGGCYWCVEAVYELLEGVKSVESGYSGGKVKNPSYEAVCSGKTGHAEVVQIVFDPAKTSVEEILKVFFTVHDPTTLNRQGADAGTQYRSVIFYRNQKQEELARSIISELNREKAYPDPIVTEVSAFSKFYRAEDYHQDYYFQNKEQAYCQLVIQPKLEKFEKVFAAHLKKK